MYVLEGILKKSTQNDGAVVTHIEYMIYGRKEGSF